MNNLKKKKKGIWPLPRQLLGGFRQASVFSLPITGSVLGVGEEG
jgi:hypothetical protein